MSDFSEFPNRLKNLLKEKNLTQVEVAEKIGISKYAFNKYITGNRLPETSVLYALSKFFNKPMEWFLTGEYYSSDEQLEINPSIQEMLTVLEYIMADPDPDVHAWAKIQFKKAFSEYYELLGLDKGKQRSSKSAATDENAAALYDEKSNIA